MGKRLMLIRGLGRLFFFFAFGWFGMGDLEVL